MNLYSAPQLTGPWTFEGQVVAQTSIGLPAPAGGWVVERPKVLLCPSTGRFSMWFHLDDAEYKFRHTAVFTAPSPRGPFAFVHAAQFDGCPGLDMNLWQDPLNGEAYFIRSGCALIAFALADHNHIVTTDDLPLFRSNDNKNVAISKLDATYTNTTGVIKYAPRFEGMAPVRIDNNTILVFCSHLTGWAPNPMMLYRTTSLASATWDDLGNPTGDATSFNSQPTYVVQQTDAAGKPFYMYLGDNWVHAGPNGLIDAGCVLAASVRG